MFAQGGEKGSRIEMTVKTLEAHLSDGCLGKGEGGRGGQILPITNCTREGRGPKKRYPSSELNKRNPRDED